MLMVVAGLAFYAITLLLDMCELTGFKVRYNGVHVVGKSSWKKREVGKYQSKLENFNLTLKPVNSHISSNNVIA